MTRDSVREARQEYRAAHGCDPKVMLVSHLSWKVACLPWTHAGLPPPDRLTDERFDGVRVLVSVNVKPDPGFLFLPPGLHT